MWYREEDVKAADCEELRAKAARAGGIRKELEALAGKARGCVCHAGFDEYVWGAAATEWLLSLLVAKKKFEYGQSVGGTGIDPENLIADGRAILSRFKALWLASGREPGLEDVAGTFEMAFAKLAEFSTAGRQKKIAYS
jgi:hypothetical protein